MTKNYTYHFEQKILIFKLLFVVFFILVNPTIVYGEDGTLNFYVTPEFPESQVVGNASYFNINAEPGSTHKLKLKIQNANDQSKTIQVTSHTAFTNVMGVVEYGKDADEDDPTLLHSISDLVETIEPIEISGNETKTVEIPLRLPNEAFKGLLAGGLRISESKEETDQEPIEEEGLAIENEFVYVIGVVASNERDSVQADLELLDVFADQLNYRNVISANIQNFTSTFVNGLQIEAQVREETKNEILYQANQEQMQMAPNSNFNFPISLNGDRFRSGDYVLHLTARSGEDEWVWERKFTIKTDEARKLNRNDVTIDTSINWWMIGFIVMIVVLLGIIYYIIVQKKQK